MDSCFPTFVALDVFETFEPGIKRQFAHCLKSHKVDGEFLTEAKLVGMFDGQHTVELDVDFDVPALGIPYTVYAILVTKGSDVALWYDFTNGCDDNSPPFSVSRGTRRPLRKIKEIESSLPFSLHLILWGRLS
jgi:hypothetical protein